MSNNLGKRIQEVRKKRGFSQREFASLSGITQVQLCRIERGNSKRPYTKTLKAISKYLEIDLEELLSLAGYSKEKISLILSNDKSSKYEELLSCCVCLRKEDFELVYQLSKKVAQMSSKDKSIIKL
ncbi:MAG: helix-turn-helix transcriptional regulator [Clostridia bacterium]|nr:helix-turn-helix transcriptional regulator [Clostridia bacterium]